MNSKSLPSWLGLFCGLFLVIITFNYFPIMGHDYSLAIPTFLDMRIAWTKYGVLNPQFSPQKCLGLPIWANPSTITFSIVHFLLLFFSDLSALSIFIFLIGYFSFYGAYQLAKKFELKELNALYLATGWTLQGWMIVRVMVGHITYLSFGLFPLIILLFLKKTSKLREVGSVVTLAFLFSQFVYFPAAYLPFFFAGSMILVLPIHWLWRNELKLRYNLRFLVNKVLAVTALTVLLVLPKVLAIFDLMKNFPREQLLERVGVIAVLPYSVLNLLSFWPHNFEAVVGWSYGNWEAVQFIYPAFLIYSAIELWLEKQKIILGKLALSLSYLVLVSVVFTSGILSGLFSHLPFLKSMHVNPRWNILTLFSIFLVAMILCRQMKERKLFIYLLGLGAILAPLLHLDETNLKINYPYHAAYDQGPNRLEYCYEPWLGYHLEYFPKSSEAQILWGTDPFRDPRCYLSSSTCKPGTLLNEHEVQDLVSYRLLPSKAK